MQWIIITIAILTLLALLAYQYRKRKALTRTITTDKEELFIKNCKARQLSNRETEVARLILKGWTYKAVGEHLFISEKTVDSHVQNIYAKTGARNKLSLLNLLYS